MTTRINRRDFLALAGLAGAGIAGAVFASGLPRARAAERSSGQKDFFFLCGELFLIPEDLLMQRQDECLQRCGIELVEIARLLGPPICSGFGAGRGSGSERRGVAGHRG